MEIQLFNSPQFGNVRTAGTPEEPLFCLADICRAVDLTNPSSVKQRLEPEDTQLIDLHALNGGTFVGNSMATFINESAVYEVILFSGSEKVRPFRRWLTKEVIPTIRKTGGYIQAKPEDTPEELMAKALLVAKNTLEQQKQKLQILEGKNALLEQENSVLAPKADYADRVLQAPGTYTISEMAKELNFTGWKTFVAALKKKGIMFKHPGGRYMLYSEYSGRNYTTSRTNTFTRRDGSIDKSTITVWTEEGRRFLHKKFNVALQPVDLTMFNLPDKDL